MSEQERIETMAEEIEKRMEQAKNVVGSMNKGIGYYIAEDLIEKGYTKEYISEERARKIGEEMFDKVRKETAKEIYKWLKYRVLDKELEDFKKRFSVEVKK